MIRVAIGAVITAALTLASMALFADQSKLAVVSDSDGYGVFLSKGCNGCHSLDELPGNMAIGPDLSDIADRAGQQVPGLSAEEYVRQSLTDPQSFIVPGFGEHMPTLPLTAHEVDQLVELLLGLD